MKKQNLFRPPLSVRNAARRGLELRRRFGRGGLKRDQALDKGIGSGVQRATNLANGDAISIHKISRMRSFFERHKYANQPDQRQSDGGPTSGTIAWLLEGGNPGHAWANRILREQGEVNTYTVKCKVEKVDTSLGIVFGYAIVCKNDDNDYYDVQGDHITEDAMLDATAEFMAGERCAKMMHEGGNVGRVVFGFPLTIEIAKSLGISAARSGFIVGMQPDDDEILDKYRTGEFTGFSIGGHRIMETVVE